MMYQLENGIHDIPNEIYHDSQGVSRSGLMELKRSPYHYWYKYFNPNRKKEESTPSMKIGEYVHALVLEPEYFSERYIIEPELSPVPKIGLLKELGREEYDKQKTQREAISCANELIMEEFKSKCDGKEIIKLELYKYARALADSVLSNDIGKSLFDGVKVEQSIYFTHEPTGLQCKVRPDAWLGSIVTDLKTCADASFKSFQSAAYRSGYFLQAAMIKRALESIGETLEKFIFFCVEKTPCMPCVYYLVDDEAMSKGEKEFDILMFKLADCINSKQWHSYEAQILNYPKYAIQYDEEF